MHGNASAAKVTTAMIDFVNFDVFMVFLLYGDRLANARLTGERSESGAADC
jgi:hypothetical protein